MKQYHELLKTILAEGDLQGNRTGHDAISIFGHQMRFDLSDGFPLMTTKRVAFDAVVHELLWFIKGDTNIKYLKDRKVNIWNGWADSDGNLGSVYGAQWRSWPGKNAGIDQLALVIKQLQTNPESRRHIVSAWNVADLPDESISPQENVAEGRMALAPCHTLFQFYVANNKLSCQLYQRSADVFIGLPFNIASYSLLTHMVAKLCGYEPGEFIWTGGNVHIYEAHLESVEEQLRRKILGKPKIFLSGNQKSIDDFKYEDIKLVDYYPYPRLFGEVFV